MKGSDLTLRPELPGGLDVAPIFVPDATYGAIKGVGADELPAAGVRVLMANSLHLMRAPGVTRIKALGGLKTMMAWPGLLMTDSGGFQALSLLRENPKNGRISRDGLTFSVDSRQKVKLTPERAIVTQLRLGADVMFCLDDCTHPDDPFEEQELSVERTIRWAKACKKTFVDSLAGRQDDPDRPRLFAVVQGGRSELLRRRCAEALLEIGFDGYGYGGWPIDSGGKLLVETFELLRSLIPDEFIIHALGVGHPVSVACCARLGYATCDSALPTRDARRGRLYRFRGDEPRIDGDDWFEFLYIQDEIHARSKEPIAAGCPCLACRLYGRGYLNHLAAREEPLFWRLATLHNLTFMRRLTDLLAAERDGWR